MPYLLVTVKSQGSFFCFLCFYKAESQKPRLTKNPSHQSWSSTSVFPHCVLPLTAPSAISAIILSSNSHAVVDTICNDTRLKLTMCSCVKVFQCSVLGGRVFPHWVSALMVNGWSAATLLAKYFKVANNSALYLLS